MQQQIFSGLETRRMPFMILNRLPNTGDTIPKNPERNRGIPGAASDKYRSNMPCHPNSDKNNPLFSLPNAKQAYRPPR